MYFEIVFGVATLIVSSLTYTVLMIPAEVEVKVDSKKMFWEGGF